MSYQEKRNVMSVVVGVIILGVYGIYAYGRYQSGAIGAEDLTAWAQIMLVFAGIMVAAQIAAHVILHIMLAVGLSVKETVDKGYSDGSAVEKQLETETSTDELVRRVELKSARNSYVLVTLGFIAALISLVLGGTSVCMLNVMFVSFNLGIISGGISELYYYRAGF